MYFDNLQVLHARGPLIPEQHYYPQGLTMTGITSAAFGKLQTGYGYQGKEMQAGEFSDTTGLKEYDLLPDITTASLAGGGYKTQTKAISRISRHMQR